LKGAAFFLIERGGKILSTIPANNLDKQKTFSFFVSWKKIKCELPFSYP